MQELLNDAAKAGNLPELLRFKDSYALPTLVPNFGFVRAGVVLRARLLPLAVVALLLGGTSGGRYASTDRVCQNSPRSLFSRHLRSFKKNKCGCPPGPQPYPHGVGWVTAGTQCEGVPLVGAHPLPPCPAVLQEWRDRRDVCGGLRPSRDRREARRRARRREHQRRHLRVRLPRRPVRRRSVGGGPTAPAPSGRSTALHYAAAYGRTKSAVALLVGGADQTVTDNAG